MPKSAGPLPSIASLRAFVTAARQGSFTRAAAALTQTQSAVSHQIRALEAQLGVALFRRAPGGPALTAKGKLFLGYAEDALARLAEGRDAVAATDRRRVLTVSMSPNFAAKWLVPRLADFTAAHPDLELRISATADHVDLRTSDIDVAIRHGDGHWPALQVTRLCSEELFPVCSPAFLAAHSGLRGAGDLAGLPLLLDRDETAWRDWLARLGLAPNGKLKGAVFSQASLTIDAALAGQGVALARTALATLDLAAGRLVRPVAAALPAAFAYWILSRREHAQAPAVARFRDWLLRQARADAARPAARPARASRIPAP